MAEQKFQVTITDGSELDALAIADILESRLILMRNFTATVKVIVTEKNVESG